MLVSLKNGLTLLLPDSSERGLHAPQGYFILSGERCAEADLSITPAHLAICPSKEQVYELKQLEIVLGTTDDLA